MTSPAFLMPSLAFPLIFYGPVIYDTLSSFSSSSAAYLWITLANGFSCSWTDDAQRYNYFQTFTSSAQWIRNLSLGWFTKKIHLSAQAQQCWSNVLLSIRFHHLLLFIPETTQANPVLPAVTLDMHFLGLHIWITLNILLRQLLLTSAPGVPQLHRMLFWCFI